MLLIFGEPRQLNDLHLAGRAGKTELYCPLTVRVILPGAKTD